MKLRLKELIVISSKLNCNKGYVVNSNTDMAEEQIVLLEVTKQKKKIVEFKNLLLKEIVALPNEYVEDSIKEFTNILEKSVSWTSSLAGITQRNLKSSNQLKQIEDISFLKTAAFLVFFEGVYLSYINVVCLLLIKNGHDLYNIYTKKYVNELKDIEAVDSCTKFEFVKLHGFGLIVRNDDRYLRNKIAHLNYTIIDEDRIKMDGSNINIHNRSFDLFTFGIALNMLTFEALNLVSKTKNKVNIDSSFPL